MRLGDEAILTSEFSRQIVNFMNFTGAVRVEHLAHEAWASVAFSGARHRLRLDFDGIGASGAVAAFLDRMADLELAVPGRILAELSLLVEGHSDDQAASWLELEALLIDEDERDQPR